MLFSIKLQAQKENLVPDVLCLQEVFRRSDAKDIVAAVKNIYPHYASFQDLETSPSSRPACMGERAQAFGRCLQQCSTDPGTIFNNCSVNECADLAEQLPYSCLSCLVLEIGSHEDTEVDAIARCMSTIPVNEYIDAYGVLLLSRYPLSDVTTKNFLDIDPDSVLSAARGYITAVVSSAS